MRRGFGDAASLHYPWHPEDGTVPMLDATRPSGDNGRNVC
jgi:hypothetical protein